MLLCPCCLHLLNELTTESVDDTSDGWSGALADEVKVEHALHSTRLHAIDETSRLGVEEQVLWVWAGRSGGSSKAADVVVWLLRVSTHSIGDGGAGALGRAADCGHCEEGIGGMGRKEGV